MKFKSDEERQFWDWLQEAGSYGLVSDIVYEPPPYQLSLRASMPVEKKLKTKTKIVDKFLLHPHQYTADFTFIIKHGPLLDHFVKVERYSNVLVDTKGSWANRGAKQEFSINRKWMFQMYGRYINKIVPKKLFKDTWVPDAWMFTPKTRKPVKSFVGCRKIGQYLQYTK